MLFAENISPIFVRRRRDVKFNTCSVGQSDIKYDPTSEISEHCEMSIDSRFRHCSKNQHPIVLKLTNLEKFMVRREAQSDMKLFGMCVRCWSGERSIVSRDEQPDRNELPIRFTCESGERSMDLSAEQFDKNALSIEVM